MQAKPEAGAAIDLVTALRGYAQVDGRKSLLLVIRQLEAYAAAHPADYESRARLANAYTLLGVGYSRRIEAKEAAYTAAIRHAESALLTEPGFAHVWEARGIGFKLALQQLDHRHLEAMAYLKLALLMNYLECSGPLGKLADTVSMQRAIAIMDRIAQIDANAMSGNNRFTQGLYLFARPMVLGGDREAGRSIMKTVVHNNARNLFPRWARARYVAVETGQRRQFVRDLQWVREQPLDGLVGYRPWNLMMQRHAEAMLANEDRYFRD